jgi:hypothetical protein
MSTFTHPVRRSGLATRRKAILTVHVVASVGLLGVSAGSLVSALFAATAGDPQQAHAVYELMRAVVFRLAIPFAVVALVTGVLLGLSSKWGVFRYAWVRAKLALLVATAAVGAAITGPALDRASTGDGGASTWILVGTASLQVTMLLAATVLSVYKPRRARPASRER